jgi:hypothetical protein
MEGLMRKQHEAAAAAAGQQQEQQPGQQGDHVKLVDATPIPTGTHGWCLLFVLCVGPAVHGRACPCDQHPALGALAHANCCKPQAWLHYDSRPPPFSLAAWPAADMRWAGPSEASGARAARLLPCCFALLEAGVEALAVDTQVCNAGTCRGSCTRRCCSVHRCMPLVPCPALSCTGRSPGGLSLWF